MSEDPMTQLLSQARQAQARMEWDLVPPDFEQRLAHRIHDLACQEQAAMHRMWRAIGGCSVLVGLLAVWFVIVQAPLETEDDLSVYWDSGSGNFDM